MRYKGIELPVEYWEAARELGKTERYVRSSGSCLPIWHFDMAMGFDGRQLKSPSPFRYICRATLSSSQEAEAGWWKLVQFVNLMRADKTSLPDGVSQQWEPLVSRITLIGERNEVAWKAQLLVAWTTCFPRRVLGEHILGLSYGKESACSVSQSPRLTEVPAVRESFRQCVGQVCQA